MCKNGFILNEKLGYFKNNGVDVMAFDDFYPSGHQSGITIIMHGKRVATCGDLCQYVLLGDADDRWVFTENNP